MQDYEVEQAIIACCMGNANVLMQSRETLDESDFHNDINRTIWTAICDIDNAGSKPDYITVQSHLRKLDKLNECGGKELFLHLFQMTTSMEKVPEYIAIVREKAIIRRLNYIGATIQQSVKNGMDSHAIISGAESAIALAREGKSPAVVFDMPMLLDQYTAIYHARQQRGDEANGIMTGWKSLDDKIHGFEPGQLIVIGARPGMGKTSFATTLGKQIAERHNVLIFSLEMTAAELTRRIISADIQVNTQAIKTAKLSPTQHQNMLGAVENNRALRLAIVDKPNLNVMQIRSIARRMKIQGKCEMIIIDHLHRMKIENKDIRVGISEITGALKDLSKELEIPIILLSQMTRASETGTDKRPTLSGLKESGSIEADADIVILLYRDEYYNRDTDKPGVCEVDIAKNRDGLTGMIEMRFVKELALFEDMQTLSEQRDGY